MIENIGFLSKITAQLDGFNYVQIIFVLISCIFCIAFALTLLKLLSAILSEMVKLKNSLTEITSRVSKLESFVTDISKTVNSIEAVKGVLVETAEMNKNISATSGRLITQMSELTSAISKNTAESKK
jgi:ABC-type multidrug transport system fused ATPase/permease subunit